VHGKPPLLVNTYINEALNASAEAADQNNLFFYIDNA
jgi:hypothetical protein